MDSLNEFDLKTNMLPFDLYKSDFDCSDENNLADAIIKWSNKNDLDNPDYNTVWNYIQTFKNKDEIIDKMNKDFVFKMNEYIKNYEDNSEIETVSKKEQYKTLFYVQDDKAKNYFDLMEKYGVESLFVFLIENVIDNTYGIKESNQPWGQSDKIFERNNYILSYNQTYNYISLCLKL